MSCIIFQSETTSTKITLACVIGRYFKRLDLRASPQLFVDPSFINTDFSICLPTGTQRPLLEANFVIGIIHLAHLDSFTSMPTVSVAMTMSKTRLYTYYT